MISYKSVYQINTEFFYNYRAFKLKHFMLRYSYLVFIFILDNDLFNAWLHTLPSDFFKRSGFTVLNRSITSVYKLHMKDVALNNILFFTNDYDDFLLVLFNYSFKGLFIIAICYKNLFGMPRYSLVGDEETGVIKTYNDQYKSDDPNFLHTIFSERLYDYNYLTQGLGPFFSSFNMFLVHFARFCKIKSLILSLNLSKPLK